jgi:hypothetical protein
MAAANATVTEAQIPGSMIEIRSEGKRSTAAAGIAAKAARQWQ